VKLAAMSAGFESALACHLACDSIRFLCGFARFRHAIGQATTLRLMVEAEKNVSLEDAYDEFKRTGKSEPLKPISATQAGLLTWANRM